MTMARVPAFLFNLYLFTVIFAATMQIGISFIACPVHVCIMP